MKILVAPNSMKGSLNAFDFADTVEKAFSDVWENFEIKKVPVADGGDFTGEILKRKLHAKTERVLVTGPLEQKITSSYGIANETAIIEMADASGMKLVDPSELNPLKATSFGTGELISDAVNKGCKKIFLAIGGSATVDGGMGMLEALGFTFVDINGKSLKGNGENLVKVTSIINPENLGKIDIKIICDVDNPLLGENGAAVIFGPQKGASPEMVNQLEAGLSNWATILNKASNINVSTTNGMGAAGGISAPLVSFFNAEIVAGANFILEQLHFEKQANWADLVITGEGKIDNQTLNNKAPFAVLKMAKKLNKPVFAIGGKIEKEGATVFDAAFSLVNGPMSISEAMENAKELVYRISFELAKAIKTLYSIQK